MKKLAVVILISYSLLLCSCDKFTDVDFPVNQVGSESVFENDGTARAAVSGLYAEITGNQNQIGSGAFTFNAGLSADEFTYYTPDYREEFSKNNLTEQSHPYLAAQFWTPGYRIIYRANLSLEKLERSTGLSEGMRKQLTGECLYMRAWFYFMLINNFGDMPLCLTSDYISNSNLPRSPVDEIKAQIIWDLTRASSLLNDSYSITERSSPNRFAAKALLAKCYLYESKWDSVKVLCTDVIGSGIYQLESNINSVFLKQSRETIWQLASVIATRNSWEGFFFVPNSNSSVPTYVVRGQFIDQLENGDLRKTNWLKQRSYGGNVITYPYKYKIKQNATISEYQVVMRLAEVLLMRAEANLNKQVVATAVADINQLRTRAGLETISNNISEDSCRRLLIRERRNELFAEWGNRWHDLKRWGISGTVLTPIKGSDWQATDVLYPIPQSQIDLNPNLTQNPGY